MQTGTGTLDYKTINKVSIQWGKKSGKLKISKILQVPGA
jgi:hypothetical protein